MAKKPTSFLCPSCGAPLKVAEKQTMVDCQYCHATIELPSDNLPPIVIQPATVLNYQYRKPNFAVIGWLTGGFVFFMISIVAFVIISLIAKTEARSNSGLRIYSINDPVLLRPVSNESKGELLGVGYNEDETNRLTFLDFSKKPIVQWQSSDLGDRSYLTRFLQVDQKIVLVSETSVSVLNKENGIKIWETSISDQLPGSCDSCLQIAGNTIFALTQIGTLHAIDLETGQQNWSVNFDEWNDELLVFENNPTLVRNVEGIATITTFDGETGKIISETQPTCPNHIFTDRPQEFDLNATIIQHNNNYFVLYGFWDPGCFEKWDPVTNSRDWQTLFPENIARTDHDFLFSEEWVFLSSGNANAIWKVNLQNGEAQEIFKDDDYYIRAVHIQKNILIVEADRIKGSNRFELWGVDHLTGKKIWQFIPKAEVSMDGNPSSIVDSSGFFAFHALPEQLVLLQAFDDPATLTFDLLDFKTGVSKSQTTLTLKEQTIFSLDIIGWQDQIVWLDTDEIIAFDSLTGQPLEQWP